MFENSRKCYTLYMKYNIICCLDNIKLLILTALYRPNPVNM